MSTTCRPPSCDDLDAPPLRVPSAVSPACANTRVSTPRTGSALPRERLWESPEQGRQALDHIRAPMIGGLCSIRVWDQPILVAIARLDLPAGTTSELHPCPLDRLHRLPLQTRRSPALFGKRNARFSSLSNVPSAPHKNHLLRAVSALTLPS